MVTPVLLENGPPRLPGRPIDRQALTSLVLAVIALTSALTGAQLGPFLLPGFVFPTPEASVGFWGGEVGRGTFLLLLALTVGPLALAVLSVLMARAAIRSLDAAIEPRRGHGLAVIAVMIGVTATLTAAMALWINVLLPWDEIARRLRDLPV
jgi:hypothetical protein